MSDEEVENELFLHYSSEFKATRVIGNILYPTKFKLETDIWLDFDDLKNEEEYDIQLNLAISKFNFFLDQIVDMSLIFCKDNEWASSAFLENGLPKIDNHVVLTPREPSDDHIAMVIQSKLSSLGKGYVASSGLKITSDTSRGLSFTFVGDALYSLPNMKSWIGERSYFQTPWWGRDDASTIDIKPGDNVDLDELPSFAYSLDFLGDTFERKESNSQTQILRPTFKPKIISNDDPKND
jgi:hypothetical protein